MNKKQLARWLVIVQIVAVVCIGVIIFKYGYMSNFVQKCPSQYGLWIMILYGCSLVATFVGHPISLLATFDDKEMVTADKPIYAYVFGGACAICLALSAGWVCVRGMGEGPLTVDEPLALLFALCATVEGYLVSRGNMKREAKQIFYVNLPLLIVLVSMIVFRYFVYGSTTTEFNSWIASRTYIPSGFPMDWLDNVKAVDQDIRQTFWVGFSTGIIAFQMFTAQITSLFFVFENVISELRARSTEPASDIAQQETLPITT